MDQIMENRWVTIHEDGEGVTKVNVTTEFDSDCGTEYYAVLVRKESRLGEVVSDILSTFGHTTQELIALISSITGNATPIPPALAA